MTGIKRRLENLERTARGDCLCEQPFEKPVAILVIENDWPDARKLATEESAKVNCPVHGRVLPRSLVRMTEADALL